MPVLDALTLRFACDQTSRSSMENIGTEESVVIYKGNPFVIEATVFSGAPASGTFINDLSNVSGATLLIRKNNSHGTVLVEKILDPDSINGALTYSEWLAGTADHLTFELSDVDTNHTVPSDKTLDIYGAISISTPNGSITVGVFNGIIKDDGTGNPGEPVVPDYTTYSRAEIDNLLANINPNQGLGNVTGPNGSMIGHIAIFSNNTGQNLDDSGIAYTDLVVNSAVVHVTGNENVAGVKTFSSSPFVPNVTVADDSGKVANTHFVTDALSTLSSTLTTSIATKQTSDATLTALAGVSTAADKLIYATGSDAFSTTTLSAFARTFLDDADAATVRATLGVGTGSGDTSTNTSTSVDSELVLFNSTSGKSLKRASGSGLVLATSGVASFVTDNRTNWDSAFTDRLKWDGGLTGLVAATGRTSLGLVIGTDVQAHDADLDAVAALTTQSFGLGLLTKSDATSVRTYLGVGTGSGDVTSAITSSTVGRLAVFSTTTGKGIGQIGSAASRGLATEIWVTTSSTAVDGLGTAEDPRNVYDTTPTLSAVKLDTLLASLGTYVRIRFLPGTYYTNHAARSWYVLDGWEIFGAGMYKTTLQSLGLGSDPTFHAPTSVGGASSATIRDLSIDINWSGRANSFTDTTASARTITLTTATSSSATVLATGGAFTIKDVGRRIIGTGVPANSWIGVRNSATSIGLSSSPISNVPVTATISNGTVLTIKEKHATVSAIYLSGSNNKVENVRATNGYGTIIDSLECFWIGLSAGATESYNNHIRFCLCESPYGTYSTPYALHGQGGIPASAVWINDSSAHRNVAIGNQNGFDTGFVTGGVNMAYIRRSRVTENDFVDCHSISYLDTGGFENLIIEGNTLVRGWMAVALTPSDSSFDAMAKSVARVSNNVIGLQNRADGGHTYAFIAKGVGITNVTFSDNTVTWDGSTGLGYAHMFLAALQTATNISFVDNIVDEDEQAVPTGTNITFRGNRKHNGTATVSLADSEASSTLGTDLLWDALGDLAYGSGSNTGAKLSGNTTTTTKVLTQTGNGTVSAAPSWIQLVSDTAFASSWDGVTTVAPSKNAVWDVVDGFAANPTTIADFDVDSWATSLSGSMPTLEGDNDLAGINTFNDPSDMRFSGGDANGVLFLTTDSPRQVNSLALANRQTIRYDGPSFAIEAYRPIWSDDTGTVTDQILASAVKPAVAVVATSNLTKSGEQTIDGQLTSGSLVLLTAQTTGSQNGPWVTAAGSWFRPAWYTSGFTTQAPQFLTTFVRLGTTYQGSTWRMTTASVTIDTTATTWVQTPTNLNSVTGTLSGSSVSGGTFGAVNGSALTSLTLANISGTGSGILTWLATPTEANLKSVVSGLGWLDTAQTWTAAQTNSYTGTASTPAMYYTGSWLTGGSGTTNFPQLLLQASGTTASTTWSTAGTGIGANAVTGFTGNLLDLKVAGTSRFTVLYSGFMQANPAAGFGFIGSTNTAFYARATDKLTEYINGADVSEFSSTGLSFISTKGLGWSSGALSSANDTGIARNAAGVVEFNSGTAGTLRDWTARYGTLTGAGAASTPALTLSGTPFAGTGTTSFPLVYLNDSTATASTTLATAGTYLGVNGHGTADLINLLKDGTSKFKVDNTGAVIAANTLSAASLTITNGTWNSANLRVGSGEYVGFSSASDASAISDTTISRVSAGKMAVGTGTTTTNGILQLNNTQLNALTVSTLPTGVAGMQAYITDGDSSLAWGATAVNSGAGATKYLVWYNGSAWTVVGK